MTLSHDTLFDGKLICSQRIDGYRFSIDSVLLAHFCLSWKKASILDIGCGSGILGLVLLYRNADQIKEVVGLECQESLVKTARQNVESNGYGEKFKIIDGDFSRIGELVSSESFSHVICNPPFYSHGRGRVNSSEEARAARHLDEDGLAHLTAAISYALQNRGDASLIFPAAGTAELMHNLLRHRLQPKRLRFVYSYPGAREAKLVLVMCKKNGGVGMSVQEPLFIYRQKGGEYTEEVEKMYLP